jgi:prepilin-type N-terminal cleavage/methylation domain-containing protein
MKAIETRRMRGQGGFTLIELLVVIAILAVLAGVVVFAVNGINNNSKDTACKTDLRTLRTAVQAYRAEKSVYPATEAEVVTGGFLEAESDNYDVTITDTAVAPATPFSNATAVYTAQAGSGCPNP